MDSEILIIPESVLACLPPDDLTYLIQNLSGEDKEKVLKAVQQKIMIITQRQALQDIANVHALYEEGCTNGEWGPEERQAVLTNVNSFVISRKNLIKDIKESLVNCGLDDYESLVAKKSAAVVEYPFSFEEEEYEEIPENENIND